MFNRSMHEEAAPSKSCLLGLCSRSGFAFCCAARDLNVKKGGYTTDDP
jgi:hypothetical protein